MPWIQYTGPRPSRRLWLLAGGALVVLLAVCVGLVIALARGDGASTVLTVDGIEITDAQIDERAAMIRNQLGVEDEGDLSPKSAQGITDQAAVQLAAMAMIEADAARRGVSVRPGDIDRALASIPPAARDDQRDEVAGSLLAAALRDDVIASAGEVPAPSEEVLARYLAANRARFDRPRSRDSQLIAARTEREAEAVRRQLEAGSPFADLFAKSNDPNVIPQESQGKRTVTAGSLPGIDTALLSAAKGDVVGPVKIGDSYVVAQAVGPVKAGRAAALPRDREEIAAAWVSDQGKARFREYLAERVDEVESRIDDPQGRIPDGAIAALLAPPAAG